MPHWRIKNEIICSSIGFGTFGAKDNIDVASGNTSEAKPKPKKICKTEARGTGTRLSRSVCKTQEEWDAKEDGQEIGLRSKTSRADMQNIGGRNQP